MEIFQFNFYQLLQLELDMKNTCRDRLENFLSEIAVFLVKKELLDSVIVIFRVNEVKSQERKLISMHNVLIPSWDLYSTFFRSSHTIFFLLRLRSVLMIFLDS